MPDLPDHYLDVGPSLTGGYRVVSIRREPSRQDQAIFDTARDVVAAARLSGAAILSDDNDVRAIARASGLRLVERDRGER